MTSMIATHLSKILVVALFFGLILRVFALDTHPPGLQVDEANAGYNAFLLLHSQKNTLGDKWPIHIDSFGDYRPALISYITVPTVAVFGLNEVSTRLPVALFGTGLIFLAYLFARECFEDKVSAVLAAVMTAISFFGIIFSRGTSEGIIDVFLTLFACLLLIKAVKRQNRLLLFFVYLCFLTSYFSYFTSRILLIPFAVLTAVLAVKQFHPSRAFALLSFLPIFLYLIFPWGYFLFTPIGQGRFRQVSVFTYPDVQMRLDEAIREDGQSGSVLISRIYHNKIIGYVSDVSQRYLAFFSPATTLFELRHPSRYFVPEVPVFSLMEFAGVALLVSSLLWGGRQTKPPLFFLPVIFLFLAPIPAALTIEDFPNFSRAVFFVPLWQVVSAVGLVTFYRFLKSHLVRAGLVIFLTVFTLWQFSYFLHQYFVHEPKHYPSIDTRATEMKSEAFFLKKVHDQNLAVALSEYDGPYIYYLFYNRINIFNTKVVKPGRYFSGDFSLDNMDFFQDPCVGLNNLLSKKYDIVIFRDSCKRPKWAVQIADFSRSDDSLAGQAYDLRESDLYHQYFRLVFDNRLEETDPQVFSLFQKLQKGLVNKDNAAVDEL